jgi:uncharacterized protein DUF3108/glycosyl transferase family 2
MIYVCIPCYNEAETVGLVLWKVRQVFTSFSREYQLLVCDDGSTDATPGVLASYARVLPMQVITHRERQGYARSLEELLVLATQRTDRPKRDSAITLHADFTHPPAVLEDLVKRLESGADVVVGDTRRHVGPVPRWFGLIRRAIPKLLGVKGVPDPVSGLAAFRLVTLKHAFRDSVGGHFLEMENWCASAELVSRAARHARRVDTVATEARYDRRRRASRTRPWQMALDAWRHRGRIRKLAHHAAPAMSSGALALLLLAGVAGAQTTPQPATRPVPYGPGEVITYSAKFGILSVGQATLGITAVDTVRGIETYRARFHLRGGALWYKLDQVMESWFGVADGLSRRFSQDTRENSNERHRTFEIFPDSGYYRQVDVDSNIATVPDPVDDASFFFIVRTLPLEPGQTYQINRYFRPDRNPITLQVVRRMECEVYGLKVPCLEIKATIIGRGIFAERNDTRLWLTDDARRLMVQFKSRFSFGTVTLKLNTYAPPR